MPEKRPALAFVLHHLYLSYSQSRIITFGFKQLWRVMLYQQVHAAPCGTWDGQDIQVQVVFEPECIGEVEASLVLTSPVHGTYMCSLKGICSPPLPQVGAEPDLQYSWR